MLDRIAARIDRSLNAGLVNSMYGNFQARTMCLLDNRRQFSDREIRVRCDLDHIHTLKLIVPNCLPCGVCPVNQQELLLNDGIREGGIETLNVRSARDEFAPGSHDPRARDASRVDGVAQFGIAINPGVSKISHRGDATLEILPGMLRAQ